MPNEPQRTQRAQRRGARRTNKPPRRQGRQDVRRGERRERGGKSPPPSPFSLSCHLPFVSVSSVSSVVLFVPSWRPWRLGGCSPSLSRSQNPSPELPE